MADQEIEKPQTQTLVPGIPDVTITSGNSGEWLASVAGKKVSWAFTKLILAKASTPGALAAWTVITDALKPLGVTIIVDQDILSKALPGFVFGVLVWSHDLAKVKTGWKWL